MIKQTIFQPARVLQTTPVWAQPGDRQRRGIRGPRVFRHRVHDPAVLRVRKRWQLDLQNRQSHHHPVLSHHHWGSVFGVVLVVPLAGLSVRAELHKAVDDPGQVLPAGLHELQTAEYGGLCDHESAAGYRRRAVRHPADGD